MAALFLSKCFSRYKIGAIYVFLCLLAIIYSGAAFSQLNKWEGKWSFAYKQAPHIPPIEMILDIGSPVAQMLYPSRLTLKYRDFLGEYNLLLVRKNESELAIARNKYPVVETPYSLGPWMMYLNGVFRKSTDDNTMELHRMWFDNFGVFMRGVYDNELHTNDKVYLREFLYRTSLELKKVDGKPWSDNDAIQEVISSDSIYYGIYDSFNSKNNELDLDIRDEERYDRDTITIVHNGRLFMDRVPVERAMLHYRLKLDSGQNYIAFFADNYGELPPNTANFILTDTTYGGYSFDFSHSSNAFATLMVASFNYIPSTSVNTSKQGAKGKENGGYKKMTIEKRKSTEDERKVRKIGVWSVSDPIVYFEFWDDQIQDGDKISILVNEVSVQKALAVLREPQRIGITLKRGINRIRFVAENEGEIPPNTAVLRAISEGKNRLFYLNTSLDVDNVLEITLP